MMPKMSAQIVLSLLLLVGAGCSHREMGETCKQTDACVDEGICLKGVCAGYGCHQDIDCADGMVCDEVGGVSACVAPCTHDGDCAGEQRCDTAVGYCL